MARILTGIQSSGKPHLGNLLGAILPALELAKDPDNECFFFIADMHSLTSLKNAEMRINNSRAVAASWLACGLDTSRHFFYKQSDLSEVAEFAWYLNCFTPFPMLANAHSFKDKSERLSDVNAGLFVYPVLMAADILMYDADFVPVGKDQRQHLEMTRDIAQSVNNSCGFDVLKLPEAIIREEVMTVPGTDGQKMSKSYNNVIDVFADEKTLKKQVMGIVTDSKALEEPKDPDNCNVFALYKLLASPDAVLDMREAYVKGGLGYGHAKKALLDTILERFHNERLRYHELMANPQLIDDLLEIGETKAFEVGMEVLERLRKALGFSI